MCGRLPVVATSAGGRFGAIGHPWSGMLLFVRSVRFLWRGSLGSGAGAAEAGVGYVSYGRPDPLERGLGRGLVAISFASRRRRRLIVRGRGEHYGPSLCFLLRR